MAMVVNETKLNAAMTATADAIREKLGSEEQIPFDYEGGKGFADAVEAIPQGGGFDWFSLIGSGSTMFAKVEFPAEHRDVVLKLPNFGRINYGVGHSASNMFAEYLDLRSITIDFGNKPTTLTVSLDNFVSAALSTAPRYHTLERISFSGILNVQTMKNFASRNNNLVSVDFGGNVDISFAATRLTDAFDGCTALVTVKGLKPNTIKGSVSFSSCALLSNESLVNIANSLNDSTSGQTLTLNATPFDKCATILGTSTGGLFVEDTSGTTTLADFITNIKGWTLGVA